MGAITPEERRRIATERQAARKAELARISQPQGPGRTAKRRARGFHVARIAIMVMLSLAVAWALWFLVSHITFDLPPTFRDWFLPPVTSF